MDIRPFEKHRPEIADSCFVDPSAIVIGQVSIGADSSIWPLVVIRGDMHTIKIGERTSIQDGTIVHVTHDGPFNPGGFPTSIGSDVTVGHQAMLHGCVIGDRVLVGMGATIMDGAIIEDEVVIGAGSLVPPGKRLEEGYLYVGSPIKQVRKLSDKEREYFVYSAQNYCKLKDLHIASLASQKP
ncbi:MAG: gamma carbonic anhydrase family protein [Pseudohongiellaceae bacterium]|nr:gamma carbonic anhydrase family protein [Pseudohongiellaceae bacterium]